MNNYNNDDLTIVDSIKALSYLIWTIAKQYWKLLIVLIVFSMVLLPMPLVFFSMNQDYKNSAGLVGAFVIMPSLLILLIMLPIVYGQISSTSIQKRLLSTGVSQRILTALLMVIFSIIALFSFYFMYSLAIIILDDNSYVTGDSKNIVYWSADTVWWSLLLFTPIALFGLSSLGIILSRWRVHDIAKGLSTFFIILGLLILSRTVISPIDIVSESHFDPTSEYYNPSLVNKMKFWDSFFLYANPFGAMIYTAQYGAIGGVITSIPDYQNMGLLPGSDNVYGLISYKTFIPAWPTFVYSHLWTFGLSSAVIWFS